jgi:predicted permease
MAVKSETLIRDVRYALRTLRRAPAFCLSAIFILGVSIGANTTMFSAIKAILLEPLAYKNPDELAVVLHGGRSPVSVANFYDWREQNRSFAQMGAAEYWTPNLGVTDRTERVLGIRVTSDTLALLGVAPLHGRLIAPDEEVTGSHHRVVIGYGLWQRAFSGDPAAIGKSIRLDGEPYTVIGVMPRDFAFAPFWAVGAELWAPLPLAERRDARGGNSLRVFARLKPGVSIERAQADITAITARLEQQFPGTNRDVVVMSLKEKVVGNTRVALVVLLVAVGFVLLIACANIAHMLLARAAARQREVAVRLALGATHMQIVRQFLVESLILASLGGLAGLALSAGGIRLLIALAPGDLPRVEHVAIDGQVLAFTLGVSMLTGLIFGLVPAWQSARPAMGDLKSGRGTTGHRGQARLRDLLIASELALALMLLIGAGLMVRSMAALQRIDPGIDPRGVLTMVVSVKGTPEAEPGRRAAFFAQALDRLRALPGVTAASAINHLPIDGDLWSRSFVTTATTHLRPEERPEAIYRAVLPGYFNAMGLPLLRGRDLTESDNEQGAPVVIVNERLARTQFPSQDPIGQRITTDNPSAPDARWMTIIGVTKDAVQNSWSGDRMQEFYAPYLQTRAYLEGPESRNTYLTLVMRTAGDPAALVVSARGAIWSIDRAVAISDVITMEDAIGTALARPRFQFMLLGLFAMVALLLAAAGIYSVMSYAISRRTQEIGLRLTLGAQRGDVLRLVLGQAMIRVAIGSAIGLAGALALTRLMANLLYGVQPTDPITFGVVSLVLIGAALLASYIPARRASRIDPMVALRQE